MNGVKTETHVRVEQTARGIWYCSGLDVYGENSIDTKWELNENMKLVEDVLKDHNIIAEIGKEAVDHKRAKEVKHE